ncbi:MAG TPA: mucoidy inhibitor MuiA family protein [Candidatus Omnitrophota bacterium]|nr:mucoidy inhibitor MuiA family protein [Candidatus Omnitrophota bacterium]
MKKPLLVLILSILWVPASVFAENVTADSRISQVTVYSNDAFVTRAATVEVNPGDTRVVLPNLVAAFDPDSLRVRGRGTAAVKILGAQVERAFLKETPVARVKELEAQIEGIEDQNKKLENEKNVLKEEKSYLDSIRLFAGQKLPEDLVTRMPTAQDLESTLVFLGTRLKENFSRGLAIDLEIRENVKKLEVLRRELAELSGYGQKVKYSVVVDIEVAKAGRLDLEAAYKVGGASWESVYDARAQLDKARTELVTYAIVRQTTGEPWDDVDMTLSTAQVNAGGSMPEVNSWFIHPYQPPVPVNRGKMMYAAKAGSLEAKSPGDFDMMRASAAPPQLAMEPEMMIAETAYTQAESKGISVVYKLPRRVTIKPDGADHKVPVTAQDLVSNFEYSAYPKMVPVAYLKSRVTNAKDIQLLGGKVNVFFEGDFVGNSRIRNIAPGEEFDLYLGADDNVKVKRELLEKKSDNVLIGNIPSSTKKIAYKYKLTAENYKAQAGKLSLFEAIPVSQDERIKVKVTQISQEPQDKDWKDRKGVWRWELQLEPKAKKEIFYTVTVEFPRDMTVEGLE